MRFISSTKPLIIMNFQEAQCKNLKFVFGIPAILLLVVLIAWFAVGVQNRLKEGKYIGRNFEVQNVITVTGESEIYAKPDLALVNFSVVTDKTTVKEAMAENTKKMNAVIDEVKKQGVEEKDLKTTVFNISPRYEWLEKEACIPACPAGRRVLVGYEISQTLQVKIRDLAKVGDIIQDAASAGANQVGVLQFVIDKQDELQKQARGQAIEKAKIKAKEMAEQLGMKLVRITNFSENGLPPIFQQSYNIAEESMGRSGAAAPQIQTGENKIRAIVSITYEID